MRFLAVNLDYFLIEFSDSAETVATYRHLDALQHPHILEMIPAASTILVYFDRLNSNAKQIIYWIQSQKIVKEKQKSSQEVMIDVVYDGEDLQHVAEILGVSVAEVIYRHTHTCWNVAFIGFAPGFGYLDSPERPFGSIPRLSSPRKKIQAGSVALAGEYTGVYPKDSPGGWQLIGRTPVQMWDIQREPPALLMAGHQVIFRDMTHQPTQITVPEIKTQTTFEPETLPAFKILKTGLQALIQDQGRKQKAAIGVGHSGAMDRGAMLQANRIVGNFDHAPVIEVLNGGLKIQVLQPVVVAITGAQSDVWVTYANQPRVRVNQNCPIALDAQDELFIDTPYAGLRHYLALRGGIFAPSILDSASYDTLAELGTPPLKLEDLIYLGNMEKQSVSLYEIPSAALPKAKEVVEVDVVLGPRTDWFMPESINHFFSQHWQVTHESNRIGLRLHAKLPLQRQIEQELLSEGTCTGALQIPPNGQPVLFMNDHPLTGGYPVLGAVASYHLDRVAQIPPDCFIQFHQISETLDLDTTPL